MNKTITAAAIAASFGAGYTAAPKHVSPEAINPAIIRSHEECESQRRTHLEKLANSGMGSKASVQEVQKTKK